MKRLLLLLIFICPVFCVSSQQMITPRVLVDGIFYEELPESLKDIDIQVAFLKDSKGNLLMHVLIPDGIVISKEDSAMAIPPERVVNKVEFSRISKLNKSGYTTIKRISRPMNGCQVGDKLPVFDMKDWKGNKWTTEMTRGKPLVLNFWGITCGPCLKEMPDLNEWMKVCPDANYFAITKNTNEEIERIVTTRPFNFIHFTEHKGLWRLFDIHEIPITVLIDKRGVIRKIVVGTTVLKRESLLKQLKELCKE